MSKQILKLIIAVSCTLLLTACSGFFDKDNTPTPTPLSSFTPEIHPIKRWSTRAGSGSEDDALKMGTAVSGVRIFTASSKGVITAIHKNDGHILWQTPTGLSNITGPGASDSIVVVGSRSGDIVALWQESGAIRWRRNVTGEILAPPAVGHGYVIVKTVDGTIRALSASDGSVRWSYKQIEPSLILRGSSSPLIHDRHLFVGFANGKFANLSLGDGDLIWQHTIAEPEGAFAIERMIDIDADPIVFGHKVYAATYQGQIISLDWASGQTRWSHQLSSYTGMATNGDIVAVSDAKSHVWSFNAGSGEVNWRQSKLEARRVTGPAIMGNTIVVGDTDGYLHWLSQRDGHFVARDYVGASLYATPIVENNVLYALTKNGYLVAYTLGS